MTQNKKNGFSLLGVIIAVFIFSVGLVGISALANYSIGVANSSKMSIIAAGLAQEGIEKIRDIRQMNANWDNWEWYDGTLSGTKYYQVQYDDDEERFNNSKIDSLDDAIFLRFNLATGIYSYDLVGTEETSYTRTLTLTKRPEGEISVIVEVKWQDKGKEKSLIAEDRLWNWR